MEKISNTTTSTMSSSVVDAFKNLNVAGVRDLSDHEAIFEVSYQYLAKIKDFRDLEAFHNCLVSLINTDKYYKAVELIGEVPVEIHLEFPLEKAYVYYKTGNVTLLEEVYSAASSEADVSSDLLRALKHVMAQSCYQNGQLARALELYHELILTNTMDSEVDMACNERAILSQLALTTRSPSTPPSLNLETSKQSYDYIFNNALIAWANGQVDESLQLLDDALAQCSRENESGDLDLELAPIKLTIAFIHQETGKSEQAAEILKELNSSDIDDEMLQLVIKTNYNSLFPSENLNLTQRALNYPQNLHRLRQKMTMSQRQVFLRNHLLLLYQTNTLGRKLSYLSSPFLKEYSKQYEGDITPLVYRVLLSLKVTLEDLRSSPLAVVRKLRKFIEAEKEKARPRTPDGKYGDFELITEEVLAALFLSISIVTETGMSKLAADDWATFVYPWAYWHCWMGMEARIPQYASLIGAKIQHYEYYSNPMSLKVVADLVYIFDKDPQAEVHPHSYSFMRAVAFKCLVLDCDPLSVKKLFTKLHAADSADAVVSNILSPADNLIPVELLEADAEVEDLLNVNVESLLEVSPAIGRVNVGRAQHKVTKKKAHKPKFSAAKVLKPESEFDVESLDTERWLPMKIRSYYKPSKKEKKKGGHQGAVEASPAPVATPAPAASKNKNASKKKKKGKK